MYYEVYIDQLFVENLLILTMLLVLCARLLDITVSWIRIWLSSISGAAASCAVIFFRPGNRLAAVVFGAVFPLFLAVLAGFRHAGTRTAILAAMFLLGITAAFGGFFQIIFTLWEPPVLLAAALACTAIDLLVRRQKRRAALGEFQAAVILEDQGDRCELTGLIDTGNHLREPLTGRPVSILERQEAEKLKRCCRMLQGDEGYLYIPFHSIGAEHGWMKGIRIDAMWVTYRKKTICIENPVLAVSEEGLCAEGRYRMILHPMHVLRNE